MNAKECARRAAILAELDALYPSPKTELDYRTPYELVVAVSLSAQCTDKKVNEVTPALFKRYPDFRALSKGKLSDVESIIRQVNYYRTKAKNIIAMSQHVIADFAGALPQTHEELITLPGVGNKTANVVLSELKITHAFPVDTHVFRVSRRLEIAEGGNVKQIEFSLRENFPPDLWHSLHHWLILHGRRICKALNPQCEICPLSRYCPSSRVDSSSEVKQDYDHATVGRQKNTQPSRNGQSRSRRLD